MREDKTVLMHNNGPLSDINKNLPSSFEEIELKPVVSVIHGKDKGRIFPFISAVTIGRGNGSDFIINDELVSRVHLKVILNNNTFIVEDLNSTNGTYIEANRIEQFTAIPGAVVHIGNSKLVFSLKSAEQIQTEKELYKAATTDGLTKISNRLWFMKRADEEIVYAQNKAMPLTMIMMDLDFFKKVNDSYGHQAGDFVLKQTAAILIQHKREYDLLGRYGGEEFIILLKEISMPKSKLVSERIRQSIESTEFIYNNQKIPITASLGVCAMPAYNVLDLSNCIKLADKLLYIAKANGRNRVEIGGPELLD